MLIEATNPFKCDRAIAMTKERTCCNAAMSEKRCATIREMKEGPFEFGNQVLISSHRKNPMFNGRRQSSRGGTSRMTRECQVRQMRSSDGVGLLAPAQSVYFRLWGTNAKCQHAPRTSDD